MSRIALITDLHCSLENKSQGVDTIMNFHNILESLNKINFDHLIIAGDLCLDKPERKTYEYLKPYIENIQKPYSIIAGNHDKGLLISEIFGMNEYFHSIENELYYAKLIGERPFLFLDTKIGEVSTTQLTWLSDQLDFYSEQDPIIIMHYPPVESGVLHIDTKYGLKDMEQIQKIFFNFKKTLNIFVGHCHVEKYIQRRNLNVFITPSCFVQIDQQSKIYKPDHFHIAYRIIDFDKDSMKSSVHYIF